jgi:hypothetical protein
MSDETVEVAFSANNQETAVLLLAAAEELGLDQATTVRTGEGNFIVPKEVADKAFGKGKTEAADTAKVQAEADAAALEAALRTAPSNEEDKAGYDEKPKAAKKTTAPAKKAAAKKSTAK